ncbi:hypothetical protein B1218_35080, partial [Pseudomonas ogarae]
MGGGGGGACPGCREWSRGCEDVGAQEEVVCDASEAGSGTFADRMLREGDPGLVIEGMIIAGIGVGATMGYIYV